MPQWSAIHPKAVQKLAYVTLHGDVYAAPNVLAQLKNQLIYTFMEHERAVVTTPRIIVTSKLDEDVYNPGEKIALQIVIATNDDAAVPVSEARVEVRFLWLQALPGAIQTTPLTPIAKERIWESETAGRYIASLTAPAIEGYYQLEIIISAKGEAPLLLSELIAIEAMSTS